MNTSDIKALLTANAGSISRRDSLAALAASLGIFALGGRHAAASTPPAANGDKGARTYNVREYGAKGDGTTLDTAAVQSAINACNADGGGTVLVPAGTFVVGTLELKSNVILHLAAAAKLLGSGKGSDYHAVDAIPLTGDSTLDDGNWALIFAVDAKNVTTCAISLASTIRRIALVEPRRSASASVLSVRVSPGCTRLTVIPDAPS